MATGSNVSETTGYMTITGSQLFSSTKFYGNDSIDLKPEMEIAGEQYEKS